MLNYQPDYKNENNSKRPICLPKLFPKPGDGNGLRPRSKGWDFKIKKEDVLVNDRLELYWPSVYIYDK